ncbi:hypothetical protein MA20_10630 [Bradyrhizobium japonicum]|uniref:Uncharacterized protein n=1 Tax=Bradyrhizobium japonicum TaxID=375 RepID=A0A0A3Y2E1_BRAJP|nr:hypothetical protein MA20_10630 [Bradyrhizobium japonicum]
MAIGLVLVATTKAGVELLIAVVAAHAVRTSAMTGKAVSSVAMVSLEAFLSVAMSLAFFNLNEDSGSIR